MKKILSLALLMSASLGFASYELAFVADNTPTTFAAARIHRFDTISGAYLGTFGESFHNYDDISAAPSHGRLYAIGGGRLVEIDYSTGITHRVTQINGQTLNMSSSESEIYVQQGNAINVVSATTLTSVGTISLQAGANTVSSVTVSGSTIFALLSNGTQRTFAAFNLSGELISTGLAVSIASVGKIGYQVADPFFPVLLSAGAVASDSLFYNFSSLDGQLYSGGGYFPTSTSNITDVAPLHVGGVLLGRNGAGQGVLAVTTYNGGVIKHVGAGFIGNGVAVTTIVAPEPASMFALAAGVAALLRRRSR